MIRSEHAVPSPTHEHTHICVTSASLKPCGERRLQRTWRCAANAYCFPPKSTSPQRHVGEKNTPAFHPTKTNKNARRSHFHIHETSPTTKCPKNILTLSLHTLLHFTFTQHHPSPFMPTSLRSSTHDSTLLLSTSPRQSALFEPHSHNPCTKTRRSTCGTSRVTFASPRTSASSCPTCRRRLPRASVYPRRSSHHRTPPARHATSSICAPSVMSFKAWCSQFAFPFRPRAQGNCSQMRAGNCAPRTRHSAPSNPLVLLTLLKFTFCREWWCVFPSVLHDRATSSPDVLCEQALADNITKTCQPHCLNAAPYQISPRAPFWAFR